MTTQDLRFRLDMIRYLLRTLALDLRSGDKSHVVEAASLVAADEIKTALGCLRRIYECIAEVEEEDMP